MDFKERTMNRQRLGFRKIQKRGLNKNHPRAGDAFFYIQLIFDILTSTVCFYYFLYIFLLKITFKKPKKS